MKTQQEIQAAGRPPFDRPLAFGDPEQIRALDAMNTDGWYCPVCYRTFVGNGGQFRMCGHREDGTRHAAVEILPGSANPKSATVPAGRQVRNPHEVSA